MLRALLYGTLLCGGLYAAIVSVSWVLNAILFYVARDRTKDYDYVSPEDQYRRDLQEARNMSDASRRNRAAGEGLTERLSEMSAERVDEIAERYQRLLQADESLKRPNISVVVKSDSRLPASKDDIEEAILIIARRLHRQGQLTDAARETFRSCYGHLGTFQPDPDAARVEQLARNMDDRRVSTQAESALALAAMKRATDEFGERLAEFDDVLERFLR